MPASAVTPVQVLRGFRSHSAGTLARYQPTQVYRQRQFQLALEMLERYYARYRPTRLLGHVRYWSRLRIGCIVSLRIRYAVSGTDVRRVAISYDREWPQDKAVEVRTGDLVASAQ
eukprot:1259053-Rhodomonas_salina.1